MSPPSDPLVWLGRHTPRVFRLGNDLRLWATGRWLESGTLSQGPRTGGQVALTFDDGPDPRWTPAILEHLDRAGARATFFMLGQTLAEHPGLAREVAAGHQVGTHFYTHTRGLTRDRHAGLYDLDHALAVHARVLSERPTAARFPYGRVGRIRPEDIQARGLTAYHWTFSSHDSRASAPEPITDRVLSLIGPGDIVLMHDGFGAGSKLGPGHRDHTVDALPRILTGLAERGLQAGTLDELLGS